MPTLSHCEPIILSDTSPLPEVSVLTDAFSEFISAAAGLELSYANLQLEVTNLSHELASRNSALKSSLAENEQIHLALKQIVDSLPCGVLVVDDHAAVCLINPEARKLLDLGSTDALHLDSISVEAGVDLAGFLRRSAQTEIEQEFCKVSKGNKRWIAVRNRPLFREHEAGCVAATPRQTILIVRDVTMHKHAEDERERARKASAFSQIAATLAHEIRNPLTSLELFAGLIADGGEDVTEWVSHLRAGIRSLAGTVNNVLSFHGVGFPALSTINLVESLRSSVDFVRPIAEQSGIHLQFLSSEPVILVRANGSALQQVVLNIAGNAIRHTGKNGCLRISVSRSVKGNCTSALIEFMDTGSGIPAEYIDEVFHPGFSGSGSTSGLGLAVCHQIIKQHDGTIRVASTPGAGTTFYVELSTL